jgi:hypothetical protein
MGRSLRILVAIFCSVIPVIILFACLEIAFRYTELRNAHELSRRILNLLYQFSSPKPYPTSPGECYYTLQHEHYLLTPKRIEDGSGRACSGRCC